MHNTIDAVAPDEQDFSSSPFLRHGIVPSIFFTFKQSRASRSSKNVTHQRVL